MKRALKRDRDECRVRLLQLPITYDAFRSAYEECGGVVLIKTSSVPRTDFGSLASFRSLFDRLGDDRSSWTCENVTDSTRKDHEFLSEEKETDARGYCSFIVQHDKSAFDEMVQSLPFPELPLENNQLTFTDAFWVFIARNSAAEMNGRPPHTDRFDLVHFCFLFFFIFVIAQCFA